MTDLDRANLELRVADEEPHIHTPECRCIFDGCAAWWAHTHGGFYGGCDDPANLEGPPRRFDADDPDPTAVRDYFGRAL